MFDTKRFHGRMPGSVTYSNVSDTRISFLPSGVTRWRSLSPSKNTIPPCAICTEPGSSGTAGLRVCSA